MIESTTLVAPDISCENCQRAVEGAVGKVDGVQTVKVDIPNSSRSARFFFAQGQSWELRLVRTSHLVCLSYSWYSP
jgi:copper chaperone CopZ